MVTVIAIEGSAPRAIGSRILVTETSMYGSIGGGNLEFEATRKARRMLSEPEVPAIGQEIYGLGPALNQCCGGAVTLLYEVLGPDDQSWLTDLSAALQSASQHVLVTGLSGEQANRCLIHKDGYGPEWLPDRIMSSVQSMLSENNYPGHATVDEQGEFLLEITGAQKLKLHLFGAGHVGKEVVRALAPLPFDISWLDTRPDQFPEVLPALVTKIEKNDLAGFVENCEPDAIYLVMTHSHQTDEDICYEVLKRNDMRWLGLIGSESKRRRFANRLLKRGISDDAVERLVCPIGHSGISGKRPATIAVAVAAQLLNEVVPDAWR